MLLTLEPKYVIIYSDKNTRTGGKIMEKYDAKFIWNLYEKASQTTEGNIEMFWRGEKLEQLKRLRIK